MTICPKLLEIIPYILVIHSSLALNSPSDLAQNVYFCNKYNWHNI